MLKIYTLSNCDTCRRATKWLRAHDVAFDERPIRETPPTREELRTALAAAKGEVRKLFNTAGREYRARKISETLPRMNEAEALVLLSSDGNLVKRPFLISEDAALVGFDEKAWGAALL